MFLVKFRTPFFFCPHIKCCVSGIFPKCVSEEQAGKILVILLQKQSNLGLTWFDRHLVFEITELLNLEVLLFSFIMSPAKHQVREPLYSNSAVIAWWLQSTSAKNSVPSC